MNEQAELLTAARAVLECRSFAEAARRIFDACRRVTGATAGYVALLSSDGSENEVLFLEAGGADCTVDPSLPMPIRGLREEAYRTRQTVYENDFMRSAHVGYLPEGHVAMRNVLFAPLRSDEGVVGVMGLANKPADFTDDDARAATAFGDMGAVALRRARAEDAVRQSAAMLARTERIARIGSWEWDIATDTVAWSKELFRIVGRDPAQGPPSFAESDRWLVADDAARLAEAVQKARKEGAPYDIDLRALRPDGEVRHCRARGFPHVEADGRVGRLFGSLQDVTDLRLAERARAAESRRAEDYLKVAEVMLMALDTEGRVTMANPKALDVLGYERDELVGRDWIETCIPPDRRDMVRSVFRRLMRGEIEPVEYVENRVLANGGDQREIAWRNTVLRDENGACIGTLSSGEDITERKRREAQREQLERELAQARKLEAVGRLAGGVAHDFNNKLQAILGYTDLLLGDGGADEQHREALEEIRAAARQSAELTSQLLAFARKQTIAPRVIDLNETIEGMLNMLRRLIGERVELRWRPGQGVPPVTMDPAQVDQVLANLVVNARDAIGGAGTVTIETGNVVLDEGYRDRRTEFRPGRYTLLTVSDDGEGMDPETLGRVFEPFFTTKPLNKGTGLGLATVYGIITQNDGFVNVYSEPGLGTTFKIYLPVADGRPSDGTNGAAAIPQRGGAETILLVEDDPGILKFGQEVLRRLGYAVLSAQHPREAIDLARDHSGAIDLLVTDVIMPELNGPELLAGLREDRPELRCLYMSGYTADAIARRGVLDEEVDLLQKPFAVESLATGIRDVLDRDPPGAAGQGRPPTDDG